MTITDNFKTELTSNNSFIHNIFGKLTTPTFTVATTTLLYTE